MGAFADRCPECGKFVRKGSTACPHCGAEMPEPIEPAPVAASRPERSVGVASWNGGPWGAARVLGGAVFGALLAVMALAAGAGDRDAIPDDPPPSAPAEAAIAEDAPRPTEPQRPQTPATEAESSAESAARSGLSAERRSRLASTIAAIRAELSTWRERYRIGHSDLSNIRSRLDELEQLIETIPQRKE